MEPFCISANSPLTNCGLYFLADMCDHVCELCGFKCVCSLVTFLSFQKFFTSSPLLGCIAWVGRSQVVPFIEFFYGGCVIGRLSKITIKPGLCTKPEFGTIGSKRYLTGCQKVSGFTVILVLAANYTAVVTFWWMGRAFGWMWLSVERGYDPLDNFDEFVWTDTNI